MNARSFKVIFSKRLGALVAVGENATSQGKSASGEASHNSPSVIGSADSAGQHIGMLKALCLAAIMGSLPKAFALDANALPTGADVRHGAATVGTEGATMTINQSTSRATINWQSFNVGTDARVNVVQNNSQSVLLNRVVGNEMSQIRGQISANGQVILVNPNGIVMGPTGRITASAFTASTFGITDANFEAGHMKYERNGSTGKIVHQGQIQTAEAGGYVALIGADVSNEGTITTRQGAVVLAAADAVTLPSVSEINNVSVPLSRNVRLEINPESFGSANVSNSGVIVTDGGQVLMRAAAVVDAVSKIADATVVQSGSIDTTGAQGGGVDILADNGRIRVSGSIKANSTNGAAGGDVYIGRDENTNILAAVGDASGATLESQGGFIETSGSLLKVDDISIKAKDWLLDPTNIRIVSSTPSPATPSSGTPSAGGTQTFQDDTAVAESQIQNTTINTALNGGVNVIISTGLRTDSIPFGTQDGNIIVAANIAKTTGTDAKLTLIANNGITLNGSITGSSQSGVLNVEMIAHGDSANKTNSQGIVINQNIITNGDITLTATIDNTSSNTEAIRFNNATISARKYNITGTHKNAVVSAHGIVFHGTNSFTATQNSSIRGVTRGSSWPPSMGVYYLNGSNTTFNSGAGHTSIVGVLTGSGDNGTRVSFNSGANITTNSLSTGSVTLGSNEAGASFFHRRGTIRADSGTLNILGSSITTYEPGAIIQGDNGTTINLSANSVALGSVQEGASRIRPEANGGFTLNIATDSLVVQPGPTTSSGTGTTTIKNFTTGTRIDIGGADVAAAEATSSTEATPATLGLSQAEINSFTAGKLVIGDSTNTGGITISQAITTNAPTGNLELKTGGNININAALTVGGAAGTKNLTLDASGTNSTITSSAAGVVKAEALKIVGANAQVAMAAVAHQVKNLSADVKSLAFKNTSALTVAAKTNGGNIAVETTQGTLTVGTVDGIDGLTVNGGGNVTLVGTSTTGDGIQVLGDVKSTTGDVTLKGSTGSTAPTNPATTVAGIQMASGKTISGKNVLIEGTATAANTSVVLGFRGAGSTITASNDLTIKGSTQGGGSGVYTFGDQLSAGTGTGTGKLVIEGTSKNGHGVKFDQASTGGSLTRIQAKGNVDITGTTDVSNATRSGITLNGVSVTSTDGSVDMTAASGSTVAADAVKASFDVTSEFDGSNTVTAKTGVTLKAEGNLTVPVVTNTDSGDVVLAAGSNVAAGTGAGGQIKTLADGKSAVSNGDRNVKVYTGQASTTDALSNLNASLANLYLAQVGANAKNTQFNTAFDGTMSPTTTSKLQVFFREKSTIGESAIAGGELFKTYGGTNTTNSEAARQALLSEALKNSTANSGTNANVENDTNAGKLIIAKSTLIDDLLDANSAPTLTDALYSRAGFLRARDTAYSFGALSNTPGTLYGTSMTTTGNAVTVQVDRLAASISATPTNLTANGTAQTQSPVTTSGFLPGDDVTFDGGVATGTTEGTYNVPLAVDTTAGDASNYTISLSNANLVIAPNTTPLPPNPIPPVTPPTPSNNTVVIAGGGNSFQLAGADGQCSADTLEQCECESATNPAGVALEGVQICYEPKNGPSSAL